LKKLSHTHSPSIVLRIVRGTPVKYGKAFNGASREHREVTYGKKERMYAQNGSGINEMNKKSQLVLFITLTPLIPTL